MKLFLCALIVLLLPQSVSAASQSDAMRLRVELRRQERLAKRGIAIPTDPQIRLGRQVQPRTTSPRRVRYQEEAIVLDVVDGDQLHVLRADGTTAIVLIIGIDAPDFSFQGGSEQCYAYEAWQALRGITKGLSVSLQEEDNVRDRDRFGRLIRFVQANGRDVGAWMLINGFAFAERDYTHRYTERYAQLETDAREDDIGLWRGPCDYDDSVPRLDLPINN